MNMISGSTGLSGAADSTFVLQKNSRLANVASLHCTGRDIPDRTLKLEFGEEDHIWKLLEDSKTCSSASKISALQLVHLFSALLSADPAYTGTPSALSAKIDPDGSLGITPKKVTRLVLENVETLKHYERNEARYVLQLPENYVTISINLGFGKAELESLILALAELDLTIDEWFCFKLKDWILADRLSKEDDSGE